MLPLSRFILLSRSFIQASIIHLRMAARVPSAMQMRLRPLPLPLPTLIKSSMYLVSTPNHVILWDSFWRPRGSPVAAALGYSFSYSFSLSLSLSLSLAHTVFAHSLFLFVAAAAAATQSCLSQFLSSAVYTILVLLCVESVTFLCNVLVCCTVLYSTVCVFPLLSGYVEVDVEKGAT